MLSNKDIISSSSVYSSQQALLLFEHLLPGVLFHVSKDRLTQLHILLLFVGWCVFLLLQLLENTCYVAIRKCL
jgi:hypothetical protein